MDAVSGVPWSLRRRNLLIMDRLQVGSDKNLGKCKAANGRPFDVRCRRGVQVISIRKHPNRVRPGNISYPAVEQQQKSPLGRWKEADGSRLEVRTAFIDPGSFCCFGWKCNAFGRILVTLFLRGGAVHRTRDTSLYSFFAASPDRPGAYLQWLPMPFW